MFRLLRRGADAWCFIGAAPLSVRSRAASLQGARPQDDGFLTVGRDIQSVNTYNYSPRRAVACKHTTSTHSTPRSYDQLQRQLHHAI